QPAPVFLPAPDIRVPRGFRAEVYASGLHHPTAMAYGPDSRLYVTEDVGEIVRVRPNESHPRVMARDIPVPLGLAWIGRRLFVSAEGRILSFRLSGDRLVDRSVVVWGLPHGEHQQDNVVAGADGRLYVGSGSTCNRCVES